MKKMYCIVLIMLVSLSINLKSSYAYDHLTFQEIDIIGGKLLRDYSNDELEPYYQKTKDRKFAKVNIEFINNGNLVYFKDSTLFSYYNEGTTSIDYTYKATISKEKKMSFDTSGQVTLDGSGSKASFKGALKTALKIDYKTSESLVEKEEVVLQFKCDPNTRVIMYLAGEGYLYTGVSRTYWAWIETEKGGFEYFTTSTIYQVVEKVALS